MTKTPQWLYDSRDRLRSHDDQPWDADDSMPENYVLTTPIGELVTAFATHGGPTYQIKLAWLTMFAARRAIPCWKLYSDSNEPVDALAAIQDWLATRKERDWTPFTVPPQPTERGVPIVDCRACDTGCVADATSQAASFIENRSHQSAICSLAAADMAFDQSPVGSVNNYRQWFIDVAIPGAHKECDLTVAEQAAFQDYDNIRLS